MVHQLGKKKATFDLHTMRSSLALARHLDPLGTPPPASNDYVKAVDTVTHGDWGMMGNDDVGDCVIADDAHFLMLRTANAGAKIVIPTTAQVLKQYSDVTGYDPADPSTDQGTDEVADDAYMVKTGFLGHKADAVGSVDPHNLDHIKWGVQLFGRVRLGIAITQRMMDEFDQGKPWDLSHVNQSDILGGHDVPIVKYDPKALYVVTWGKLQAVTYKCFAAICTNLMRYGEGEAHVGLFADWIRAQGTAPSGFDLATLEADLKHVVSGT